jgi:hypothetical protein
VDRAAASRRAELGLHSDVFRYDLVCDVSSGFQVRCSAQAKGRKGLDLLGAVEYDGFFDVSGYLSRISPPASC